MVRFNREEQFQMQNWWILNHKWPHDKCQEEKIVTSSDLVAILVIQSIYTNWPKAVTTQTLQTQTAPFPALQGEGLGRDALGRVTTRIRFCSGKVILWEW